MSCCDQGLPLPTAGAAAGDEIEIEISGLASDGAGLGRADGLAVFVTGALPGERVRARVIRRKKNYARAEMTAIIEPSRGASLHPARHTMLVAAAPGSMLIVIMSWSLRGISWLRP